MQRALQVPFWVHAAERVKNKARTPDTPVEFHPFFWKNVSEHGKHFVSLCLTVDPKKRPRAVDLLTHTWLKVCARCCCWLPSPRIVCSYRRRPLTGGQSDRSHDLRRELQAPLPQRVLIDALTEEHSGAVATLPLLPRSIAPPYGPAQHDRRCAPPLRRKLASVRAIVERPPVCSVL